MEPEAGFFLASQMATSVDRSGESSCLIFFEGEALPMLPGRK